GRSKWTFGKLLNYGLDGLLSFNNKPLRAAVHRAHPHTPRPPPGPARASRRRLAERSSSAPEVE
ncbi:hypothetical protein ACFU8I_17545, partial [Streptomyces sp. NPDC057540]|uniref:hypothetical protein n=1 Tax=Streptomyces sp. NPDC057540 TaxID=3346160 RepID=UPI00367E0157